MKTRRESRKLLGGICMVLGSLVFSLMVVLLVIAQPAQAASSDYSITLKVSHGQAGSPHRITKHGHATRFKEIVETQTDGAVKVEIYPLGQLYKDKDSVLAVANGTIFGSVLGSDVATFWEKSMYIFSFPGLFQTNEALERFIASEKGGQVVKKRLIESGLFPVWYYAGRLAFFTVDTPITTLADSGGLKLRCNESEMNNKVIQALDASAVNMSSSEMYTAIQTGMVDGAFTIEIAITGRKMEKMFRYVLWEPVPFFTQTCGVASVKILNTMPPDIRKIVEEAWVFSGKLHGEIDQRKFAGAAHDTLLASGVKYTSLEKESKEAVVKKWTELSRTFSERYGIKDLYNEALRLAKE